MFKRFRYRRIDEETRMKYRQTFLSADDFIWPVFLVEGKRIKEGLGLLDGVYRYSADMLFGCLSELIPLGLRSVLLFGVPAGKGIEQAYSSDGIVQKAIPVIKEKFPNLEIITDVCLCSYTYDGHCHIGDNDKTCEILAKVALSHASAGADIVAPSDMMDGRVQFIKKSLVLGGFNNVKILSYAAKYASNFYGPFREAACCAPKSGDRKTYQMDFANSDEALEEINADIEEGADQIMIKPALSYLDIIARARAHFKIPITAYNVSGEYQMLKSAIRDGICNENIIEETLVSIKRAGAGKIVSYFTPYILRKLKE
ncbi:MAG: porphobilinogen synthase [Candidatus Omnitrophota bacterium]|nr:porphobilinogen synthase [Candidatus Omnitrophota bacterium]MBU3929309.1 porphobilinogen synthase [bacterium]MBU4122486.1 porphobilinogen synthase [bacterium]